MILRDGKVFWTSDCYALQDVLGLRRIAFDENGGKSFNAHPLRHSPFPAT